MEEKKQQSIIKKVINFFDDTEDTVRHHLSHRPILYTFIGGFAIVLFWRGVWMTADMFPFLTGPVSILISVCILLFTGLFVSFFIGDRILLTGLRGEKKLIEKTESELRGETHMLSEIQTEIQKMEAMLTEMKEKQNSETQTKVAEENK